MKLKPLQIIILLTISSCGLIKTKLNKTLLSKETPIKTENEKLSCSYKNKFFVISENENASTISNKYLKNKNYTFEEKVTLAILIHSLLRPDLVSPNARFQGIIGYQNTDKLYNFYNLNSKSPFEYNLFVSLENILKNSKSKKSLKNLIYMAQNISLKLEVDEELNMFFEKNISSIKKSKTLSARYTRGQQVLQTGETIVRPDLMQSYKNYLTKKPKFKIQNNDHLFPLISNKKATMSKCNFDSKLYQNGSFIIQKEPVKNSIAIIIKDGSNKFALVNIHQNNKTPLSDSENVGFFKEKVNPAPATFCILKDNHQSVYLLSNKTRDSSQLLFNLIESRLKDKGDLSSHIAKARKLKLFLPERIIYESSKDNSNLLNELNQLDIPIYHAEKLGLIWGIEKEENDFKINIDERGKGNLVCPN